jgi:hypothetical protein
MGEEEGRNKTGLGLNFAVSAISVVDTIFPNNLYDR